VGWPLEDEAFRNNPRLLLHSPSPTALAPGNHLNALISATFVPGFIPGIKHGSCHRAVSPISAKYRQYRHKSARPCARWEHTANFLILAAPSWAEAGPG
jgi:hypothetical protein